ncbi:MAG: dUTP diphosphatase [Candidatus Methanoperedens sp.]|nr:dUTP diphosphatase [Candidatus Methanoperedens sp.]
MKIQVKKLHEEASVPEYKSNEAAGFDFVALEETHFKLWETKLVRTGIAIDVGPGYQLEVRNRSGMALKTPMRVTNSPGTVDADYRGEVYVMMTMVPTAMAYSEYTIKKGERIAQGVVMPAIKADIEVVSELNSTDRGAGGFGSTGK